MSANNGSKISQAIVVGLSGPSSAGKTTVASLMSRILPKDKLLMIHADDFGKEFDELPLHKTGVLDADSRNSVHFDMLRQTIEFAVTHGHLPPTYKPHDFVVQDVQRASTQFDEHFVEEVIRLAANFDVDWSLLRRLIVVDGFLLFHDSSLSSLFNVKILLRTTKVAARMRRLERYRGGDDPEQTGEFWKTARYFDTVVWPNYVEEHAVFFPDGGLEDLVDEGGFLANYNIFTPHVPDLDVRSISLWAIEALLNGLRNIQAQRRSHEVASSPSHDL